MNGAPLYDYSVVVFSLLGPEKDEGHCDIMGDNSAGSLATNFERGVYYGKRS